MLNCPICDTQYSDGQEKCSTCEWDLSLVSVGDKTSEEILEIAIACSKVIWQKCEDLLKKQQDSQQQHESQFSSEVSAETVKDIQDRVDILETFEEENKQQHSELQKLLEQHKKQITEQIKLEHQNNSQFSTKIQKEIDTIKNTTTDKSQLESELSRLKTQLQEQITSLKTDSEEQLQSQLSQIKSNTEQEIHALQTKLEEFEDYINNLFKKKQVNTKNTNIYQEQSDMVTQILPSFEEHKLIKELVREYNQNYESNSLATKIIEVSETPKSMSDRSVGASQEVILEEKSRGMYGIITKDNYHYLVPSKRFRITDNNYKTVQALFECDGYQKGLSENFKLAQPARVSSLSSNQQWQLEETGVLEFELD